MADLLDRGPTVACAGETAVIYLTYDYDE